MKEKYFKGANPFFDNLNFLTKSILQTQNRIFICIAGKPGSGKSTFGKYLRKNGFGDFSKYQISVIDDSVMSLDLFYFINLRFKFKSSEKDELEPFLKKLPKRKKIIIFVNQSPEQRLSKTDILINLSIKESTREQRLLKRWKIKETK